MIVEAPGRIEVESQEGKEVRSRSCCLEDSVVCYELRVASSELRVTG
jgi:hypothetical protein